MKPLGKVKIKWLPNFAYAIGLLATDGCLANNRRHIDFTSNDKEQLVNFMRCLGVKIKISYKISGYTGEMTPRVQFGDINFCRFLLKIGLMPAKTKIISALKIPKKYFFDFLRGHFDGDGTFYSYWDPRWKSSYMFYTEFVSASKKHIDWLREGICKTVKIRGHITHVRNSSIFQLKYAKKESLKLLPMLYYDKNVVCLSRKRIKIERALEINRRQALNYARVL